MKYFWNLRNSSIKYNIQWKVVNKIYGNANLTMCKCCPNPINMTTDKAPYTDPSYH